MKKNFQILLIPTIYLIITSSSGGSTPAWQKKCIISYDEHRNQCHDEKNTTDK